MVPQPKCRYSFLFSEFLIIGPVPVVQQLSVVLTSHIFPKRSNGLEIRVIGSGRRSVSEGDPPKAPQGLGLRVLWLRPPSAVSLRERLIRTLWEVAPVRFATFVT